jgi:hypothetical protein
MLAGTRRIEMSRKTEEHSAAQGANRVVWPARGLGRRRVTVRIIAIALALLVGGLGGYALYLLLEAF